MGGYKIIKQTLSLLLLVCLEGQQVSAQHRSDTVSVHFRVGKSILLEDYMDNRHSLKDLDRLFSELAFRRIDSIVIVGYYSPEGSKVLNELLVQNRAEAMQEYLLLKYPHLKENTPIVIGRGEEVCVRLSEVVRKDTGVPQRAKVLAILSDRTRRSATRLAEVELLSGGVKEYLRRNIYPYMRSASSYIIHYLREMAEVSETPPVEEKTVKDTVVLQQEAVNIPLATDTPEAIVPSVEEVKEECLSYPLFALKTNLLFDIATTLNVELEIPIGKRWSISGEWIFPWWQIPEKNWTMQILSGQGAVKYWFGNRDNRVVLTGWYLGINGGAGKYDIQLFKVDGVRGEFFNAGILAGYAHKIGKNLRMEYSLGLGYMRSDLKQYDKVRNTRYGDIKVFRYPWETQRLDWIGPTSAKISFVWLLNYKSVKR